MDGTTCANVGISPSRRCFDVLGKGADFQTGRLVQGLKAQLIFDACGTAEAMP